VCFFLGSSVVLGKGALTAKQARKLIAEMPGVALKTGVIHVGDVRSIDNDTAQAAAEIAMPFKLEKSDGDWRVAEFRTGQERWESVDLVARALKVELNDRACQLLEIEPAARTDPSNRQARCLVADLLGIQLPSDSIRIREISSLSLPLSSKDFAVVDTLLTVEFQFSRSDGSWRVSGVRTGNHAWVNPETIFNALNTEKIAAARAELETLARGLEDFRRQTGHYVEAKSGRVLVDFLSPRYLRQIIRLDPWGHPYLYEGTQSSFSLRSLGPDGQENTSDDLAITGPGPSAATDMPRTNQ